MSVETTEAIVEGPIHLEREQGLLVQAADIHRHQSHRPLHLDHLARQNPRHMRGDAREIMKGNSTVVEMRKALKTEQ